MLEILLIFLNLLLFILIFKELYRLKKEVQLIHTRKKYLTKELFQNFKSYLYILSAISSGMKTNLEFDKLDEKNLSKGLSDISTNIKKIQLEISDLENKLLN